MFSTVLPAFVLHPFGALNTSLTLNTYYTVARCVTHLINNRLSAQRSLSIIYWHCSDHSLCKQTAQDVCPQNKTINWCIFQNTSPLLSDIRPHNMMFIINGSVFWHLWTRSWAAKSISQKSSPLLWTLPLKDALLQQNRGRHILKQCVQAGKKRADSWGRGGRGREQAQVWKWTRYVICMDRVPRNEHTLIKRHVIQPSITNHLRNC